MSPADGYRHLSSRYDRGINPVIEAEQPVLAEIVDHCEPGKALDVACGTGRVTALLAKGGHSVVGIDASDEMRAEAITKVPGANFVSGDLTNLPVPDEAFDLVTCCLALTHSDDLFLPIAELARTTKPGGTIILSDVHPQATFLGVHAGFSFSDNTHGVIANNIQPLSDYVRAIRAAGLSIRECLEPCFSENSTDLDVANESLRNDLGPDLTETVRAALVGFPIALIWELEK